MCLIAVTANRFEQIVLQHSIARLVNEKFLHDSFLCAAIVRIEYVFMIFSAAQLQYNSVLKHNKHQNVLLQQIVHKLQAQKI